MRKFLVALGCLGLVVAVVLSSGTFFVAREARDFVSAEVDKERSAQCEAMRAELEDTWGKAVDGGQIEEVEEQLAAAQREVDRRCGKD